MILVANLINFLHISWNISMVAIDNGFEDGKRKSVKRMFLRHISNAKFSDAF